MLQAISDYLMRIFYMVNMLPIVVVYLWRLERRAHLWPLRLVAGAGACMVFAGQMPRLFQLFGGELAYVSNILVFLLELLALALLCLLLCRISFLEAVYCVGVAYMAQHCAYSAYQLVFMGEGAPMPVYIAWLGIVCILLWLLVVRGMTENGHFVLDSRFLLTSFFVTILIVLVVNQFADKESGSLQLYLVCMAYDLIACVLSLWVQVKYRQSLKRQREFDLDQQLWLKQKELYRMRQEDAQRVNMICHDLKKQVQALQFFSDAAEQRAYCDQILQTIQNYDARLETGNKVLDVLLSQKNLVCVQNDIELTCMADGKALDFIHVVDLSTIFGNALDNAMDSVLQLTDPEQKVISISARRNGPMLQIQVENYFDNPRLVLVDGLPATSKNSREGHGYGLKSIRRAVEKYHGTLEVSTEQHIFSLNILIPCPEKA